MIFEIVKFGQFLEFSETNIFVTFQIGISKFSELKNFGIFQIENFRNSHNCEFSEFIV